MRKKASTGFVKNVVTLMTGTMIAQAIPVVISPILTRLYSPSDFGVFSLFMSFTAIMGAIANAKYEQAVVLPESDDDAKSVLSLCLIISFFLSLLLLFLALTVSDSISRIFTNNESPDWIYFVPLFTFLIGVGNSLSFYNIRNKKFAGISVSQVAKSTSGALTQVLLGFLASSWFFLVVGQFVSLLTGNYVLYRAIRQDESSIVNSDYENIKSVGKRFDKFPKFSMPSVFINSINLNSVNILISSLFSVSTLGFFSITQRVVGAPIRVIGNSVTQVYFQRATEEFNRCGSTNKIFVSTVKKLVIISLPVFFALYVIAEPLFSVLFGGEWVIAGTYAKVVIPLAAVRFVSSTLSVTLSVHQCQQFSLLINVILLFSTCSVFLSCSYLDIVFLEMLYVYTAVLSVEYLIFLFFYYCVSRRS